MMESIAGGLVVLSLMPFVLGGLAVAYVALRVRDARAEPADPQLGLKAACYSFLTAGILLALSGVSIAVIDLLGEAMDGKQPQQQPQPQFNPQFQPQFGPKLIPRPAPPGQPNDPFDSVSQRVAWPLVISGTLFALGSLLVIRVATNDARFPAVRRTFAGMRLAVAGLTAMVGITYLILLLFQKEGNLPNTRPYASALGTIIIWVPTAIIHLVFVKSYSNLPYFVPPKEKKKPVLDSDEFEEDRDEGRQRDRRRPPRRRAEEEESE
jgi:hypothetical protein